jgi:NAD+ kinase
MARIRRALVFANGKKTVARRLKRDVLLFLEEKGVSISQRPQLVITIGGDGTALYNKEHYGLPYFAIGSKTSFICQADYSNWRERLLKAIVGVGNEKRLLLECNINGKKMPLSLNEIGVRNPRPRVLSFHLKAGKKDYAFRADGLLFCTPTGSPAYCYSCGGKEMARAGEKYQVVAISPFRRLFPPLALGREGCVLRIKGHDRAQFFIDGQEFGFLKEGDTLRVKPSRKKFLFSKC